MRPWLPAWRNCKVVLSRLVNPVVNLDFCWISNRGKKLPRGADDFTSFLKSYTARWAPMKRRGVSKGHKVGVAPDALIFGGRPVSGALIGGIAQTQEMLDFCG